MKTASWDLVNVKLDEILALAFKDYNFEELTSMQKRNIIFNYLTNNLQYDYQILEGIKSNYENKDSKVARDLSSEVMSVIYEKKGICNAISQVYKLLLEKIRIYCMCICCNDSTNVPHQLNLVYNKEENTFSFDDITSVIVGRGTKEDFFNYDIEGANRLGQGNKDVTSGQRWLALPTEMVYFLVGRKDNDFTKLGFIEKMGDVGIKVPTNIKKSSMDDIIQKKNR